MREAGLGLGETLSSCGEDALHSAAAVCLSTAGPTQLWGETWVWRNCIAHLLIAGEEEKYKGRYHWYKMMLYLRPGPFFFPQPLLWGPEVFVRCIWPTSRLCFNIET